MCSGAHTPGGDDPLPGSRLAPLTVTQLNELADAQLREGIGPVWVAGEIVRFVAHGSGHWYFSLTDGRASISCAMFRRENLRVRFTPGDGLEVLALALPSVYAVQGRFQLAVSALEPVGAGSAALAFEQLKARLAAEGLFDATRKRPLPALARRIGVVTSPDGAALRDVLRVLARRLSGLDVLVVPATVQGAKAPEEIVAALAAADACGLDLLLVVRGGGAREDLAAFDDERVVRAIVASRSRTDRLRLSMMRVRLATSAWLVARFSSSWRIRSRVFRMLSLSSAIDLSMRSFCVGPIGVPVSGPCDMRSTRASSGTMALKLS